MKVSSLFGRRSRRTAQSSVRRYSFRPSFETLEDRTVPSGLGVDVVPANPHDWPMYNHDPEGTRHNIAEHILSPTTVGSLEVKWSFETAGPVAGTPAVVNNHIYAADVTGAVYALDRDGQLLWQTQLEVGFTVSNHKVTTSALVTNRTVVIGDQSGQIHGLDVDTGAVKWITNPNPHPFAAIWGSATMVGNYVAVGTSSNEWVIPAVIPGYAPSFRGSLALLDPGTGDVIWQTFTITEAENTAGASGAAVWGSPTYDRASNTIFVGTSNNYSQPTTGTSDALIAFDAATGEIKWVNQRTEGDEWTMRFGDSTPEHPDFDIADSPQVYKLGGRTVVSAGQKSGFFHVLDAATGEEINDPIQLAPAGTVGGLFADSAYANGVVYANGTDWPAPLFSGDPPNKGILSAVAADGSHELWRFETPFSPNISGVAVANNVVYFQSGIDGTLYALDAVTGDVLAQVVTGGQSSGPAVSRGQIYLGTGDTAFTFLDPTLPLLPGSIIALGITAPPGRAPSSPPLTPVTPATGNRSTPWLLRGTGSIVGVNPDGAFLTAWSGNATLLGHFTATGTLVLAANGADFSGTGTDTAANGDQIFFTYEGSFEQPVGTVDANAGIGTAIVTGGTGRFALATGLVDISGVFNLDGTFEINHDLGNLNW